MTFRKVWLFKITSISLLMAFINLCYAEGDSSRLKLSGFLSMEGGQFVKYKYRSTDFSHKWLQRNILGLSINAGFHPRLDLFITSGGILSYNTTDPIMVTNPDNFTNNPIVGFYLGRAEMLLHFSPDPEDSLFDVGIGLWQEKYNHEARNLGEYLFRSGAYPGYIYQTGFDECFATLAGIHIDNNLFGIWHNELFLTSELFLSPFNDFSLAYVTDLSIAKKMFNIGAGIQFFRCFSVDPEQTTQKNVWKNGIIQEVAPNYYTDSVGVDEFGLAVYDTSYYTFAGTKLMGRFTFDPKPMFSFDIFGPEDLKLYFEIAILGLKKYPNNLATDNPASFQKPINKFGFDTLGQKTPMMFGFNFPTFKVLDVLSIEVEYYGKKYVNAVPIPSGTKTGGYYAVTTNPIPAAAGGECVYDSLYEQGGAVNWKWSVYIKKTLFKNFSITAQAARDHILNTAKGLSMLEVDREEALVKSKQWYWMLKFGGDF